MLTSRRARETTVEVPLFEVQNGLFAVGNILGEEIVEVVELQGKEDTTRVGESGGQDRIQNKPAEASWLRPTRRRRSCISSHQYRPGEPNEQLRTLLSAR